MDLRLDLSAKARLNNVNQCQLGLTGRAYGPRCCQGLRRDNCGPPARSYCQTKFYLGLWDLGRATLDFGLGLDLDMGGDGLGLGLALVLVHTHPTEIMMEPLIRVPPGTHKLVPG